jgi:hypothetical protein
VGAVNNKAPTSGQLKSPRPDLQISFALRLADFRRQYLPEALRQAVESVPDVSTIDKELSVIAPPAALTRLAANGIRGEIVFPTPCILNQAPHLLGYYRLLFGISQKDFYGSGGFGRFKRLEKFGEIPGRCQSEIASLCAVLGITAATLVEALDELTLPLLNNLQLLTLGAQLRGEENNVIGASAVAKLKALIDKLLGDRVRARTERTLQFENASGRKCLVVFGSDPDIVVNESIGNVARTILSIEVKGGKDQSNVHNRLGEAEKSHLKAKRLGCTDLWTITKVRVAEETARDRTPTTTRFFLLDDILEPQSAQNKKFVMELLARIGLPDDQINSKRRR